MYRCPQSARRRGRQNPGLPEVRGGSHGAKPDHSRLRSRQLDCTPHAGTNQPDRCDCASRRPLSLRQSRDILSFENLPYIRLPKAPIAWEERYRSQSESILNAASVGTTDTNVKAPRSNRPRFIVSGNGWEVGSEETLPPNERPDPAFKQMFPTAGSTLWLDPKGRHAGFPSAPAVALTTDRAGAKRAERGLKYDVYRADVNADGSGIIFLSRDGILHGYTETLELIMTERVKDLPEYAAQAQRFGIEPRELKNHTRCVALSTDRSRHLVTVVDEAWCYDLTTGHPIWGLRFPAKDGWTEIAAERSDRVAQMPRSTPRSDSWSSHFP